MAFASRAWHHVALAKDRMKLVSAIASALSSLGLGLILNACSSVANSEAPTTPPTSADAGSDAVALGPDSALPDDTQPIACPPVTDGYEVLTNAPPRPRQTVCTEAELTELVRDCVKSADRYEDLACKAHKTACAACMTSKGTEPTWGAIVELVEGGNHGYVPNQSGCVDHLTGLAGCGDRILGFADCADFACPRDRCTRAEDRAACVDRAARKGACAALAPSAACQTAYAEKATSCASTGEAGFRAAMKAFCQAP